MDIHVCKTVTMVIYIASTLASCEPPPTTGTIQPAMKLSQAFLRIRRDALSRQRRDGGGGSHNGGGTFAFNHMLQSYFMINMMQQALGQNTGHASPTEAAGAVGPSPHLSRPSAAAVHAIPETADAFIGSNDEGNRPDYVNHAELTYQSVATRPPSRLPANHAMMMAMMPMFATGGRGHGHSSDEWDGD